MLGDTGVAVHPDDERYRHLVGKQARLPILDRLIPIVADDAVDPAFGTGAVKVTPAHDPNDFEIGKRHGLPAINVMNLDGTMNDNAGPFAGMPIAEARSAVVARLRAGRPPGRDRAAHPRRRPLRALRHGRRAADHDPVVRADGAAGATGDRRGQGRQSAASCRSASGASISTGWRTSTTGASPASSGGDTASRSGTASAAAR